MSHEPDTTLALQVPAEREPLSRLAEMGDLFVLVMVLLFLYTTVLAVTGGATGARLPITLGVTGVAAVLTVVFVWRSPRPLGDFGVTAVGARMSVVESVLWTLPLLAVLALGRVALHHYVPSRPLFIIRPFPRYAVNLIIGPLQELIARGTMQGTLQRLMVGKHGTAKAVLATGLLFGLTHLHYSVALGVATVAVSVLWGSLYARRQTLVGVSVSHVCVLLWCDSFWSDLMFPE